MSTDDQTALAGPDARPAAGASTLAPAPVPVPASPAGARHGSPRPAPAVRLPGLLRRPWLVGLLRRHWIFATLMAVGALVRLVAMLGYRPAPWDPDSSSYVEVAVQLGPAASR